MQKDRKNSIVYSASDLVHFLLCPAVIGYDIRDLETPLPKAGEDEFSKILQQKGFAHERDYFEHLRGRVEKVVDIQAAGGHSERQAWQATLVAMADGADIIFQGFLRNKNRIGYVDFLRKVSLPSRLGDHSYEIIDTKLSVTARPQHVIQLCFYADLLAAAQGAEPERVHLLLGDGRQESYRLRDYYFYYRTVLARFEEAVSHPDDFYPQPCGHCDYCRWRELCDQRWTRDDHLLRVAGLSRVQIKKLEKAGITTLAALAKAPAGKKIVRLHPEVFKKLRKQAALKKLMSLHGTREYQVDELLRRHKLVDLYQVVRQGLMISEPRYSLKNLERFYMEPREAGVTRAADSVIFYEKWKTTRDPALLEAIRAYNQDDCRSTCLLHQWLLSIKPKRAAYCHGGESGDSRDGDDRSAVIEYEMRLAAMQEALLADIPSGREDRDDDRHRRRRPPYPQLPVHPGAAGNRQDLYGRARHYRTAAGGQACRRFIEQPQGHQQSSARHRGVRVRPGSFLFRVEKMHGRKRLNVALSRARSLAVLVANPRLLQIDCNTVEQMELVNSMCRAYYEGQQAGGKGRSGR